jgi:hypothetical protein
MIFTPGTTIANLLWMEDKVSTFDPLFHQLIAIPRFVRGRSARRSWLPYLSNLHHHCVRRSHRTGLHEHQRRHSSTPPTQRIVADAWRGQTVFSTPSMVMDE